MSHVAALCAGGRLLSPEPTARPPCGARPARPLAARATSYARCVGSKPGQAPQASRHPPVGRPLPPGPTTTHRHRSHTTDVTATPASAANPHRIRTTPSGLDNSRTNKPSTTCAQPQDLTEARQRGDVETNNTTARPQQRTAETGDTSAPGKCTKNNHFSPAKAMAVSTPHRHTRAKATGVSDNRAASLTGTGSATHSH